MSIGFETLFALNLKKGILMNCKMAKSLCQSLFVPHLSVCIRICLLMLLNAIPLFTPYVCGEIPDIILMPQTNCVNGYTFNVKIDKNYEPPICLVIVFVSHRHKTPTFQSMYVEIWDNNKFLASFQSRPASRNSIPKTLLIDQQNSICFMFALDQKLLDKTWCSIGSSKQDMRRRHECNCVIRLSDWVEAGP